MVTKPKRWNPAQLPVPIAVTSPQGQEGSEMYNDADIEQNESIRNAPKNRLPAGKIDKRAVEMLNNNYQWSSMGMQIVELGSGNEWFLEGLDRIVSPAGTENPCDGYRFAN